MTTPRPTPDRLPSPEAWRELSMLYLFGELDAAQRKFVQQQLETFPELGQDLLRQAEVIAGLSQAEHNPPLADVAERHRSVSPWTLVTSIVAIAACIALVMLGFKLNPSDRDAIASLPESALNNPPAGSSEDVLIARAWAHQRDAGDDFEFIDPDVDEEIAISTDDDSLDNDATLSWIFVAVSANSDSLPAGGTNDG